MLFGNGGNQPAQPDVTRVAVVALVPELPDGDAGQGERQRPDAARLVFHQMPRGLFRHHGDKIASSHQFTRA